MEWDVLPVLQEILLVVLPAVITTVPFVTIVLLVTKADALLAIQAQAAVLLTVPKMEITALYVMPAALLVILLVASLVMVLILLVVLQDASTTVLTVVIAMPAVLLATQLDALPAL